MNRVSKIFFAVMIGFALLITTGCAKQLKYSGFLENYPELVPGQKGEVEKAYLKEGVDFTKYDKVMMDHVVFYVKDDAKYKGIHSDVLEKISDEFRKSFADALEGSYPLVDEPGPDVLRLRIAITEVVPSKETIIAYPGPDSVTMMPYLNVASAAMEAELLDSVSGERIGVAIDRQVGKKPREEEKAWKDIKNAFDFWAKRLKVWLDEVHGR